jgi:MoxR-like ATPase
LPEAQLDRFFFKLLLNYATREEMSVILDRTTRGEQPQPQKVMDGPRILHWQKLVREVLVAPPVQDFAIRLVLATHPGGPFVSAAANRYIRCGASPRGAQALVLAAKVKALLSGRVNVSFDDIRGVYFPALRHRILLNFEAQAENIPSDQVLGDILKEVKEREASAA